MSSSVVVHPKLTRRAVLASASGTLKGEDVYAGRLDAESALLRNGFWELHNAHLTVPERPTEKRALYRLPTSLTLDRIQESFAPPQTLSFWELPQFIATLESAGLSSLKHRMFFYRLLAQPLLLCAMVLLAAVFTPRSMRRGGTLAVVISGIVAGFILFMTNDVALTFGVSGTIPPFLAAWAPAIASLMLGVAALLQKEDG